MNYVYIVECSDGTLYTGWTKDIDRRLQEHNQGIGARYTRGRHPVELLFLEEFASKEEAMSREFAIKKLNRREKLDLIKNSQ
ncbi:MAG: GIY-YIG nuclease family protein [Clostridiaceae bacterium]|jgi:putative endonuclease|nr:GIY-YIG nuclease family protein [Clostridiaceae bacterium]